MIEKIGRGEDLPKNLEDSFSELVDELVSYYFNRMNGEVRIVNGKASCVFDVIDGDGKVFRINAVCRISPDYILLAKSEIYVIRYEESEPIFDKEIGKGLILNSNGEFMATAELGPDGTYGDRYEGNLNVNPIKVEKIIDYLRNCVYFPVASLDMAY